VACRFSEPAPEYPGEWPSPELGSNRLAVDSAFIVVRPPGGPSPGSRLIRQSFISKPPEFPPFLIQICYSWDLQEENGYTLLGKKSFKFDNYYGCRVTHCATLDSMKYRER